MCREIKFCLWSSGSCTISPGTSVSENYQEIPLYVLAYRDSFD